MSESFSELFEQSLANQDIKSGIIITGQVIEISNDVVIVSAGLKSEAVIPKSEFRDENGELEVEVGDDVEVALDSLEDGTGETRLSRERAKRERTWTMLEEAYEAGKIINGIINGRVKGGFTVAVSYTHLTLPTIYSV